MALIVACSGEFDDPKPFGPNDTAGRGGNAGVGGASGIASGQGGGVAGGMAAGQSGTFGAGGSTSGPGGTGGVATGAGGVVGVSGSGGGVVSGTGGSAVGGSGGAVGGSGAVAGVGTGGSGPPPSGHAARGVQLTLVEANQSTAVALSKSGSVLPVAERNAVLIEGRATLVRIHFKADSGFQMRPLLSVLNLEYGDGTQRQLTATKTVSASSNADELDSTFNFLLAPDQVKPGMKLHVELQEPMQPTTPEPAMRPRFPQSGSADVGITAGLMQLNVVVIPGETSGGFPQSTEERRKKLHDHLHDLYPVQKVNITWREPLRLVAETDRAAAFDLLRSTCEQDKAGPDVVYHLILREEDTGFSFAGTASGRLSPTRACRALALTVVSNARGTDVAYIDGNVNTVAHEIAHNHGRGHVACGGADGADESYPYEEGFMGVQGYSLSENELRTTDEYKDLMGYCRPRWISDWNWNALASFVRTVSVPDQAAFAIEENKRSLSGYVDESGSARWAIVSGGLTEPGERVSASRYAQLSLPTQAQRVPVSVLPASEPGLSEVVATLPEGALPSRIEVVVDGAKHSIDVSKIPHY